MAGVAYFQGAICGVNELIASALKIAIVIDSHARLLPRTKNSAILFLVFKSATARNPIKKNSTTIAGI